MTGADWKRIRHFDAGENWGDAALMYFPFVHLLDCFRDFLGKPMVISRGTQGTHVRTSLHYSGRAVDAVFPGMTVRDGIDLFIAASRFDFTEIGIYVGWQYPKGMPVAGMHLGFVTPNPNDVARKHYWIGTEEIGPDHTPARIPVTLENLRAQGFLASGAP